jgi:hypothetical protein
MLCPAVEIPCTTAKPMEVGWPYEKGLSSEASCDLGLKSLKNLLASVYNMLNILTPSIDVRA